MASGERFTVRHPENAACDDRGRSLTIYDQGLHPVEMLSVDVMEPAQAPTSKQGNGDLTAAGCAASGCPALHLDPTPFFDYDGCMC